MKSRQRCNDWRRWNLQAWCIGDRPARGDERVQHRVAPACSISSCSPPAAAAILRLAAAQNRGELPILLCALLPTSAPHPRCCSPKMRVLRRSRRTPRDFPDLASFDRALFARAVEFSPDLIVLAGYMRVIDSAVIEAWRGKVVNIHPSLLPKYPGLHTHARALESGDSVHGVSVHYVTANPMADPSSRRSTADRCRDTRVDHARRCCSDIVCSSPRSADARGGWQ